MVGQMFLLLASNHLHSNFATTTNPMTYRIATDPIVAHDGPIALDHPKVDIEHSILVLLVVLVVLLVPLPMKEMKVHSSLLVHSSMSAAVIVYSETYPIE